MAFPRLDESTPAMPQASPLEPMGNVGRRRKKWRSDNARRAGQIRAVEMLEEHPRKVQIPELLK